MAVPIIIAVMLLSAYWTTRCCCANHLPCRKLTDDMKQRFDTDNSGDVTAQEVKIGLRHIRWMTTIKSLIMLILFVYPSLATRVFSVLRCQNVNNVYVLQIDFNIVCWEGKHTIHAFLAIGFMFIYCFGVPACVFIILYKNRKHLWDESSSKNDVVDHEFGGLYKQYEPQYWWFEVVLICTKMGMTGMLSIVAPGTPIQMVVAMLIMQTFLLIVLRLAPYQSHADDVSIFFSSLALVLTTMGGLVLFMDMDEIYFSRSFVGMAMIVLCAGVLLLQFCVLVFVKMGYGVKVVNALTKNRSKVVPVRGGGDEDGSTGRANEIDEAAKKAWEYPPS